MQINAEHSEGIVERRKDMQRQSEATNSSAKA